MITRSGRYVDKDVGVPSLMDIAYAASRIPRFGGHTDVPWTLAQHLLVVYEMAKRARQRDPEKWALLPPHLLLHDAHEALTGDIPTSFKVPEMKTLQGALDVRIYQSLGIDMPSNEERTLIAFYDQEALLAEAFVVHPAAYEVIAKDLGITTSEGMTEIVRKVLRTANPSVALYSVLLQETNMALAEVA